MMTQLVQKKSINWFVGVILVAVVISYALSLAAFASSVRSDHKANEALQRSVTESISRAQLAEAQNVKLRAGLCDFIQPYAQSDAPVTSPRGETLVKSAKRAEGPEVFNCSPDPLDGK